MAVNPSARALGGARTPRICLGLTFGLLAAWLGIACAQPPTHHWHEGNTRRELIVDPTLEADFSPTGRALSPGTVLRPVDPRALKSATPSPFHSPVFRDTTGQTRALPGGVIVVLREPLSEAAARALFTRAGVTAAQPLHDQLWLIASPAGLPALELANRLQATGWFQSAEPNWWLPRMLK